VLNQKRRVYLSDVGGGRRKVKASIAKRME